MSANFTFRLPTVVHFGSGAAEALVDRVKEYGGSKVLVVSDQGVKKAGLLEQVLGRIGQAGLPVAVFDDVEPDPGLETIMCGAAICTAARCDLIVALGGGSPMDTAKGIRVAVENGGHIREYGGVGKVPRPAAMPLICVPTTAGTGSEVTAFAVLSDWERNIKVTFASPYLAATAAIVDPLLTVSAPPQVTAASGMDALAHSIEAYVSTAAQPPSDALALRAIALIADALRPAVANGKNLEARHDMALGSLLSGMAFNNGLLGITHSLGAAVSGHAHVSHGMAISALLPYVMDYNLPACLERYRDIAAAMRARVDGLTLRDAAKASVRMVQELVVDTDLPANLSALGIGEDLLPAIAEGAMTHGMVRVNPRIPTAVEMMGILKGAL